MIITKSQPYTAKELKQLRKRFDIYIKTVIDVRNKTCSAGLDRHFEGEEILLRQGSRQSDIWGGGIDLETKTIDFISFINIRPNDNNLSSEIQDPKIRAKYEDLTRFFFKEIF